VSGIADIEDAHGPITGLVNAAGVFGKMPPLRACAWTIGIAKSTSICAARSWSHAASAYEWRNGAARA
jgi:hypothetical protein